MKKIYLIDGLKCGHCASKIQEEISHLNGINNCVLNFYTKKLTIEIDELKDEDKFLDTINNIASKIENGAKIKKIESDNQHNTEKHTECCCTHNHEHHHDECGCEEENHSCDCGHCHIESKEKNHFGHSHEHHHHIGGNFNYEKFSLLGGLILFIGAYFIPNEKIKTYVLIVAYIIAGIDVIYNSLLNIKNKNFLDENFLMSIATIGAIFLREYREAVGVMIFYKIGEYFQERAVNNSRKSIQSLLEIKATFANIKLSNGEIKKVNPESLNIADVIIIKPGEKVPTDCIVISGNSSLDTAALTGESLPVTIEKNSEILSGSINIDGVIEAKVTREYKDSAVSKIIEMVENASDKKANSEKFITKFARYYTPIVVAIALIVAIIVPAIIGDFKLWFGRALIFLVISCPCALVLSVPLTFFSSIGLSSKRGILIKGGNYLEKLNHIDTVVFDKTGTLTKGKFKIESVNNEDWISRDELIELGKAGEFYSNHPIGKAIIAYEGIKIIENSIKDYKEISGKGVSAIYKNKHILVGNEKLMKENNIEITSKNVENTAVHIACDGKYAGNIYLADEIKNDSQNTIKELTKMNIKTYMLTGDNKKIGESIGKKIGLVKENIFTHLLPQNKVEILEKIKSNSNGIIFVGDGINDAPVLSIADIGIAMGGAGSDIAVESADIVFINDEPSKVIEALKIAKENKKVVLQNIYFSIGVKVLVMILGILGIANMWMAIFADVGVSAIAVLNASKILRIKKL